MMSMAAGATMRQIAAGNFATPARPMRMRGFRLGLLASTVTMGLMLLGVPYRTARRVVVACYIAEAMYNEYLSSQGREEVDGTELLALTRLPYFSWTQPCTPTTERGARLGGFR